MKRYGLSLLSVAVSGLAIGWLVGLSESPIVAAVISTVVGVATVAITALSGSSSQKANTEVEKASPKSAAEEKTSSTPAKRAPAIEASAAPDVSPKSKTPVPATAKPIADLSVDPVWIALFVLGIAVAAPAGIYARTARIFVPTPPATEETNPLMKDVLNLVEIGVLKEDAVEAVLGKWKLGNATSASQPTPASERKGGLMHGQAQGFCEQLKTDGAATGTVNEAKLRTAIRAAPFVGVSALEGELDASQLLKASISFCSAVGEPIE